MRTHPCTLLLVSTIGIGTAASEIRADVIIKQQHHAEGFQMMGGSQPLRDFMQKIWLLLRSTTSGRLMLGVLPKTPVQILASVSPAGNGPAEGFSLFKVQIGKNPSLPFGRS